MSGSRRFSAWRGVLLACAVLGSPGANGSTVVVTFDPPNSTQTQPAGINAAGVVAGFYYDGGDHQLRGFVRAVDGTISVFDPPGSVATVVTGINAAATTTGYYEDGDERAHGFARTADGAVATFDAAGAQTYPSAIDDEGVVTGFYMSGTKSLGFVRSVHGKITSFDVPGSGLPGDTPNAINSRRVVVGSWSDNSNMHHGFIRSPDGTIASFDPTDARQTYLVSINAGGAIAGYCLTNFVHGFVRAADGTVTMFDATGALDTEASGINRKGVVTGYSFATDGDPAQGFIYRRNGTISTFHVRGAGHGREQGTYPLAINDDGTVAGFYVDKGNTPHGFLRTD